MKHPYFVTVLGALLTFAMAGAAQTAAKPAESGRLAPALRGGDGPNAAAPARKSEKPAKEPTVITAREATFDNRAHLATFSGDVVVTGEFNVTCDAMTVHLKTPPEKTASAESGKGSEKPVPEPGPVASKPGTEADPRPDGDSGSGIEKAIAEGNVVITQDKIDSDGKKQHYKGTGRKAVFESETGNVTLYGAPTVEQLIGGSMSKKIVAREDGCVITLNRAGKIDVKGYHTTTLQDTSSLDKKPR